MVGISRSSVEPLDLLSLPYGSPQLAVPEAYRLHDNRPDFSFLPKFRKLQRLSLLIDWVLDKALLPALLAQLPLCAPSLTHLSLAQRPTTGRLRSRLSIEQAAELLAALPNAASRVGLSLGINMGPQRGRAEPVKLR